MGKKADYGSWVKKKAHEIFTFWCDNSPVTREDLVYALGLSREQAHDVWTCIVEAEKRPVEKFLSEESGSMTFVPLSVEALRAALHPHAQNAESHD